MPDRWVPEGVDLGEVDALWRTLVESNPRFHDGDCLHVLGVVRNGHAGATIHLAPTSYRFHAVRSLGMDTGVRPLGVKGLAVVEDDVSGARLIVGRRSRNSGSYPGRWEFLPGGGVEADPEGRIDLVDVVRRELAEETGREARIDPVALAVLEDRVVGTWEVVFRMRLVGEAPVKPPGWEHDEIRLVDPDELPAPASDAAIALQALARRVVETSMT
ncbi:MAG: NUDIX hydrolase [Phycisphaera sp.]|nr:NUDIX hydrolase [Phycisphaera sp.]